VRFVLAAVLVLMLSSLALAAPETHQLGPFKASFDMNTNLNYQNQTSEPKGDSISTSYLLALKTDSVTGASIGITEYANPVDSTIQVHKSLTRMGLALYNGVNITAIDDKVIDGKNGFLETGVPFANLNAPAGTTFYQATYWLDSKDCECGAVSAGQTRVVITSTYPQDVTMNLLNSLKVEKTGQAAQKTTSSDMPPSQ
jgi:hypothetical protein